MVVDQIALVKSAPSVVAYDRLAPVKFVSEKLAFVRLEYEKRDWSRRACERFAPVRSADATFTPGPRKKP
jgi:hypothetical protein